LNGLAVSPERLYRFRSDLSFNFLLPFHPKAKRRKPSIQKRCVVEGNIFPYNMSRSSATRVIRQLDIVEWAGINKTELKKLVALRHTETKGVLGYCRDFGAFFSEYSNNKRIKREKAAEEKALKVQAAEEGFTVIELKKQKAAEAGTPFIDDSVESAKKAEEAPDTMAQYFTSQDLLKRMKWKRVTWDKDADYESFARRISDNDSMFRKVPAFSFMCLHLVHDPRNARIAPGSNSTDFELGCITNWLLKERSPEAPAPYIRYPSSAVATKVIHTTSPSAASQAQRKKGAGAWYIDWVRGEAFISDNISAAEMFSLLSNTAPRLQAIQVRMDAEQTKFTDEKNETKTKKGQRSQTPSKNEN